MQRYFTDAVICVAFCSISCLSTKALSGFLMTKRQMTLKDVWLCHVGKLHRPRMLDAFLTDTCNVDTIWQIRHLQFCGVLWIVRSVSPSRLICAADMLFLCGSWASCYFWFIFERCVWLLFFFNSFSYAACTNCETVVFHIRLYRQIPVVSYRLYSATHGSFIVRNAY